MPPQRLQEPWFLTGPTASGKTALGVALAERLGAEIISMDSMALYRRMDIGTAKPSPADRRRVPHHLVDVLEPWQEFSLADYLRAVDEAARSIEARGRPVVFVGGTPLYLTSLLRGVDTGPPPDPALRRRLEQEAAEHGPDALHRRLAAVDPAAAGRLHPDDIRRVVRAQEVFDKTGTPISKSQVHFHRSPDRPARVLCLELPRDELYRRIDARVQRMFDAGLVDEVRTLLELGSPLSRTARQALGYKEVIGHLAGRSSLTETIALVQCRSRQFAKRQLTWFRSLSECRRVPITAGFDAEQAARDLGSGHRNNDE